MMVYLTKTTGQRTCPTAACPTEPCHNSCSLLLRPLPMTTHDAPVCTASAPITCATLLLSRAPTTTCSRNGTSRLNSNGKKRLTNIALASATSSSSAASSSGGAYTPGQPGCTVVGSGTTCSMWMTSPGLYMCSRHHCSARTDSGWSSAGTNRLRPAACLCSSYSGGTDQSDTYDLHDGNCDSPRPWLKLTSEIEGVTGLAISDGGLAMAAGTRWSRLRTRRPCSRLCHSAGAGAKGRHRTGLPIERVYVGRVLMRRTVCVRKRSFSVLGSDL